MTQMTTSAQILPSTQKSSRKPHIVFLSVPPIQVLDLTGPFEVFSRVSHFGLADGYELTVAEVNPTRATCGLSIGPSQKYSSIKKTIDTLLVVGGEGIEDGCYTDDVLRWIKHKAARTRRIGSICTGARDSAPAHTDPDTPANGIVGVVFWNRTYCDVWMGRHTAGSVEDHCPAGPGFG